VSERKKICEKGVGGVGMMAGLTELWDRMLNVRRQVYQRVLYEGAVEQGVKVRFGCRVEKVDDSEKGPIVTLSTGETLSADLIVGADGLSHSSSPLLIAH
jgi:salicylate hydroxylase